MISFRGTGSWESPRVTSAAQNIHSFPYNPSGEKTMHCPKLNELPPPPVGKKGWPWNQESTRASGQPPKDGHWPKISIITPSYNQGQFLEETIRSVLLQGYPQLEYIIIDGGSTDDSVDIIKKYEPWIDYWVSEKDAGQPHALNKGFRMATGEIFAWLNSDDLFLRDALWTVAQEFGIAPETDILYGGCQFISENDTLLKNNRAPNFNLEKLLVRNFISQPSTFFRGQVLRDLGYINEALHLCFDYALWVCSAGKFTFRNCPQYLSKFRHHVTSKTISQRISMLRETTEIAIQYLKERGQEVPRSEALLGYLYLKLAVLIWRENSRNDKEVMDCLHHVRDLPAVLDDMPFLQNIVLCFLTTSPFDKDSRRMEMPEQLSDIKVFYKQFLSPRLPGMHDRYLSIFKSRACITLSLITRSPRLFFQGMAASPPCFFRITYHAIKKIIRSKLAQGNP
jgi:glycosyltransferase involved in cell wall biosynthesis